jgi:hypothetical protein
MPRNQTPASAPARWARHALAVPAAAHGGRWTRSALTVSAALALAGAAATAAAALPSAAGGPAGPAGPAAAGLAPRPACGQPPPGYAACQAITDTGLHWTGRVWAAGPALATRPRTAPPGTALPNRIPQNSAPQGTAAAGMSPYMAAALRSAYRLPSGRPGTRQTIAIVDAYDDPHAAADLASYRAANHLPGCGAGSHCFAKVNQKGQQGSYPAADPGWAEEESLDLDMASAVCPYCRIILVEADSNGNADLAAAEDEAARLGANVISNSYGESEYRTEARVCRHYDHPGIAITAAAGDSGFGVIWPAVCGSVTAVGGTTLYRDQSPRGWGELAWGDGQAGSIGTGSGCSVFIPKPSWQRDRLCGMRTVADVSAVADPATPVAVYDTFGEPGWIALGGTSVATPVIAGVYALAGNAATAGPGASYPYAHRRGLSDVGYQASVSEVAPQSNGDCGGSYLCTAARGYDGPTGLGTPDGTGAF